ncbi:MAG: alpha/beta fold hydrolase, partial [Pseudomonadota bacterium]
MPGSAFAGNRLDGPGPAVFGLHCTLARGKSLVPLMRALGRAAVLPDLPGHGGRGWDRSGSYFAACNAVFQAAPTAPSLVFGHSFGAVLALAYARAFPARVSALVLAEPVAFVYAQEARDPAYDAFLDRNAGFGQAIAAGDRASAARAFLDAWGEGGAA